MSNYTTKAAETEAAVPLMPPQTSYAQPDQPPMYSYAPVGQAQYQPDANEKKQHPYATPAPVQAQAPVVAYQPTVLQPGQPIPPGANVIYMQAPMQAPDSRLDGVNECLGLSIFTTLCCSCIFGIIAIVFSCRVRDAKRRNDYHGAKSAYQLMIRMNIAGIVLNLVLMVIVVILYFCGILAIGGTSYKSYNG